MIKVWWSLGGSNSRPLPCKGSALPAELRPHLVRMRICNDTKSIINESIIYALINVGNVGKFVGNVFRLPILTSCINKNVIFVK